MCARVKFATGVSKHRRVHPTDDTRDPPPSRNHVKMRLKHAVELAKTGASEAASAPPRGTTTIGFGRRIQAALDEAWRIKEEHQELEFLDPVSRDPWFFVPAVAERHSVCPYTLLNFMRQSIRSYGTGYRQKKGSKSLLRCPEVQQLFQAACDANLTGADSARIVDKANEILAMRVDGPPQRYFTVWNWFGYKARFEQFRLEYLRQRAASIAV